VLFVEETSSFAFQIRIGRLPFYHKTGKLTVTLERMCFSARTVPLSGVTLVITVRLPAASYW